MARIRSIHPGIFTDEEFMALTVDHPLAIALLIGLWVEADDAGTFEWKPLTLKARILPAITGNVADILAALCNSDFIRRFEIDGKPLGVIRNFAKFQRPKDPKDIYAFTEESRAYAGFNQDGSRPRSNLGPKQSASASEGLPKNTGSAPEKPCQREEGGGRMEDGQVSPSSAHSALRRLCLEVVGTEPVALAQDFHEIENLASEGVTAEDVLNGMRAAMAEQSFRPRSWKQLTGWCRRAAKDRLGNTPKHVGDAMPRAGPLPQRRSALSGAMAILRDKYATDSNDQTAANPSASPDGREPPTIDLAAVG